MRAPHLWPAGTLIRAVAAGDVVRWSDVAIDASQEAVRVRREMEDAWG